MKFGSIRMIAGAVLLLALSAGVLHYGPALVEIVTRDLDPPARMSVERTQPEIAPPVVTGALPPSSTLNIPSEPMETPNPAVENLLSAAARADVPSLTRALEAYRRGEMKTADGLVEALSDPQARALGRWLGIRLGGPQVRFDRVEAFLQAEPGYPMRAWTRRRGEELLVSDRIPTLAIKRYFATEPPVSAAGRFALATVLRGERRDADAKTLIAHAWHEDTIGKDLEQRILTVFGDLLTQTDHRARMERFLFKEDWSSALRFATLAGPDHVALVKARQAVSDRRPDAQKLIDAVPKSVRADTSFAFTVAQHLRRQEKASEAAAALVGVARDPVVLIDGDEWWVERRLIARKLLDAHDPQAAYQVAAGHGAETPPQRIEAEFHAGWIALRFLKNARQAAAHFDSAALIAETPISRARAAYWQGRAAEAAGDAALAKTYYQSASLKTFTYYGQLARSRLGLDDLPLRQVVPDVAALSRRPGGLGPALLAALGERGLLLSFVGDLAREISDPGEIAALAAMLEAQGDARGALVVGKAAIHRGLPLERAAFPLYGVPEAPLPGRGVDRAMVKAITRQESAFQVDAVSHAGARGLMQLMPATARTTALRAKMAYAPDKLTRDAAYNATLGAAHLGDLMDEWRGSYVLVFAAYNAGSPNVKKWIAAYGDPRSPDIDPVDWIERIPFTETRNYVQRVMENLQVYRQRLGTRTVLLSERDLRRGATP